MPERAKDIALSPDAGAPLDRRWVQAEGDRLSNAGRWGADDEFGMWNLVTPAKVLEAVATVLRGRVFSLSLPFGADGPEGPAGRPAPLHFLTITGADMVATTAAGEVRSVGFADDWITMNLSCSTQWDGFCHVFSEGTTYNDVPAAAVTAHRGARRLAFPAFKEKMVTRGVLLDLPRALGRPWLDPGEAIDSHMLDACCAAQGIYVTPGDVTLIRTGALRQVFDRNDWGDYAGKGPAPGLSPTSAEWFASRGVVAVATDTWGCEVFPYETRDTLAPLHQLLLCRCGITIGEMFDLEALSEDCAQVGTFDCLLVTAPLPITGSVNAPVNPLAMR